MDALGVIYATEARLWRPLAGRPLISHAVREARGARRIARLAVVTNLQEVERIALGLGAEVVMLTALRDRSVDPRGMLAQATKALAERDGFAAAAACLIDPACPLLTTALLDGAIDHLFECGADTLVSVHAIKDQLWLQGEGEPAAPDLGPRRRCFVENGAIAAVRMAMFKADEPWLQGRVVLYEIPPVYGFRIGSDDDWAVAEALLRCVRDRRATTLLKPIRLLALDFDGVMTDNRVVVFEDGREAVLCSRGDGFGFDRLRAIGFPVVVISKEGNPVVTARCRKLKLPCAQGISDKLPVLERFAEDHGVELNQVAFMGNDLNDLSCLRACGLAIAPADAQAEVLQEAAIVTSAPGGFGAVREVCDLIVAAKGEERPTT